MKFAALGRTQLLYESIQSARRAGHEPVCIATAAAAPEYSRTEKDFELLAQEIGCPFVVNSQLEKPDATATLQGCGAEVAISVNWPILITAATRSIFKFGVINAHAGDLPRYRGNAAPNWAMIAGETSVVLTLHEMADELDAGPVLLKRSLPLTDETYIADVYAFLEEATPAMFVEVLNGLEAGTLRATPQDPALRPLRAYPRSPNDSAIDWSKSAVEIARLVRASAEPFAGAFTYHQLEKLIVWRARPVAVDFDILGMPGQVAYRTSEGHVAIVTGDGLLLIEEIQKGQQRGPAGSMIRSARDRLGFDLHHAAALLSTLSLPEDAR